MEMKTLPRLFVALSVAATLSLSGCGGGGSGTRPDGGTGMTGGADTGTAMTDDAVLTVADGLTQSAATGVHASNPNDTLATLLPAAANEFAPLTSAVEADYGTPSAATSDSHIKAISSDGNNGFHVTYVVGGDERMVHFEEADYVAEDYNYHKEVDGIGYWLWSYTSSYHGADKNQGSFRYKYVDVSGFFGYRNEDGSEDGGTGDWNYLSYGARTDAASLPAGSAMYDGFVSAETHLRTDPTRTHRERMRGALRLAANFDGSTLDGMIFGIRVRTRNQNDDGWNEWTALSDTTNFEVADGQIVDGRFSATLSGVDSNSNATPQETVSGYEGGILGEFYGPGAEEVGGVLNASRQDRVIGGVFAGKQQVDPDATGLNRSTAGPVYATNASDTYEALSNQGSRFAPLTSALRRDWDVLSTKRIDSYYVKTTWLEGDLAGGTGVLHVTYVVDGEEQTVQFDAGDYTQGDGFMTEKGADRYWLWSLTDSFEGNSGYRYLDSYGFDHSPPAGVNNKTFITFGARTESADLPAGNATYHGYMRADTYKQNEPSQDFRYRVYGDLSITANFDASTLDGTISGIRVRGQSETSRSPLSATARFEIGNGQITDGQFTATLTGVDSNAAAPLEDTVRGYQGDVLGEFYGPEAEEIGGVLTAVRDEDQRVMSGAFIGKKQ